MCKDKACESKIDDIKEEMAMLVDEGELMLPIERAMELEKVEELEEQIKIRGQLIGQMGGTLYPSVLRDEIACINERIFDIKYVKTKALK